MRSRTVALISATAISLSLAACSVHSSNSNGGDNVHISTPFGGMHVESNQTTAADVGLPVYPGATLYKDKNSDSANVSMNFGSFHLKVLAVSYQSPDAADKIFAFYRTALAQFGDVLECDGNKPVGQPTVSSSGLTCSDSEHNNIHVSPDASSMDLSNHNGHQLRAGSPRSFRIVEVDTNHPGITKFGLVYLELPRGDSKGHESN